MNIENCTFTMSGQYVNLVAPDPATININDISKALSQINRFGGHTRVNYSVAQHSVIVSDLMPRKWALHGLMHDGEEAYFGDITYPVKCLPEFRLAYQKYAEPMREVIFNIYGISATYDDDCRAALYYANCVALATERRDFACPDLHPWKILEGIKPLPNRIRPMNSLRAESEFMTRFKQLTGTY